jgi:hypothetical protein
LREGLFVREYLAHYVSTRSRWSAPEPHGNIPEAECGFLRRACRRALLCLGAKMNWCIVEIRILEPEEALNVHCPERTPKACEST